MMPEDILEALVAIQPLALVSSYQQQPNFYGSTIYQTVYVWRCIFCHYTEGAEIDHNGNAKSHSGAFAHDPECVWQHARDYLDGLERTEVEERGDEC